MLIAFHTIECCALLADGRNLNNEAMVIEE